MKNVAISLKAADERRQHIQTEFAKQNIEFEFFDAITPDLIASTCEHLGINLIDNQRLSNGEKGCFLSHVYLWQKMIDENLDYLAIFEDDVYLGENAAQFLTNTHWLKEIDFDIIKLETMHSLIHLSKNAITINNQQSTINNQQKIISFKKCSYWYLWLYY